MRLQEGCNFYNRAPLKLIYIHQLHKGFFRVVLLIELLHHVCWKTCLLMALFNKLRNCACRNLVLESNLFICHFLNEDLLQDVQFQISTQSLPSLSRKFSFKFTRISKGPFWYFYGFVGWLTSDQAWCITHSNILSYTLVLLTIDVWPSAYFSNPMQF